MRKREADFTIRFRHWLKANPTLFHSCAFELKQTTKDSIPFSDVKEHQIQALMAVRTTTGLLHKISDETRGFKPFDMFYLSGVFSYVVIKYPQFFCIIDIYAFLYEKEKSKRKSLTAERAKAISTISVPL